MPTVASPPEQRVLLENVSWETYERLLAESINKVGTRFAYDEGRLEIVVVSLGHEAPNRILSELVIHVAVETGKDCFQSGSTTFRSKDAEKGFEPDSSFYFAAAKLMRGKREVDLVNDPPPELVIEVDITRSSLDRFRIFAAMGVSEVWRYDGERVSLFQLTRPSYRQVTGSIVLPPLTADRITGFLELGLKETMPEWLRQVREWIGSTRTG